MSDPSLNKKASTSDVNEQLLLDKKSSDTEDNTEGKLKRDMQSGTVLSNKKTKSKITSLPSKFKNNHSMLN